MWAIIGLEQIDFRGLSMLYEWPKYTTPLLRSTRAILVSKFGSATKKQQKILLWYL